MAKKTTKKPAKKAAKKVTKKTAKKASKKTASKKSPAKKAAVGSTEGSAAVDERVRAVEGWRGETLARVRELVIEALPDVEEDVKWRKPTNPLGVAVWSRGGIICTGETYKDKVKVTFNKGAGLEDPAGVFNASLEGNARRAVDLFEGDKVNARAFKALVKAAADLNAG